MKIKQKTQSIEVLERTLGYVFTEKAYLSLALTHKSAYYLHNERLEFLGDAILSVVIAEQLYRDYPEAQEGMLTRARSALVKKQTLYEIATEFALGDYLFLGQGELRSGGVRRESILADALEALIGAIYLDSSFERCADCVRTWFKVRLSNLKPETQEKDPKTCLQERLQAEQKALPVYKLVSVVGEPHEQTFTIECEIEGVAQTVAAQGLSRRIAEQRSAKMMLELLQNES